MSQQAEITNRVPTLTNANLQAHKSYARNTSHQSALSSVNSDTLAVSNPPGLMRMSKRNSISSTVDHYTQNFYHPQVRLENTYSLGPNDNQRFNVTRVQRLVNDILVNNLENVVYEPNRCKELVQLLSDEIKSKVKGILYKRYKLVVNLSIGQKFGSSIVVASRSLWNTETDNCCTVEFKNSSLYAIATIFASYYD